MKDNTDGIFRNHLASTGNVDYVTNTKDYTGERADKTEIQKPK